MSINKRTSATGSNLHGRITLMFLALGICLSALLSAYWIAVLEPRLITEAEARAGVLAQSQAQNLAHALSSHNAQADPQSIAHAINEILVLTDPVNEDPFVLGIRIDLDPDLVRLVDGRESISGGNVHCSDCFVTDIALHSPDTLEIIGIAEFYGNAQFWKRMKSDVRSRLLVVSGVAMVILALAWWAVVNLMHRVRDGEENLRKVFEAAPFPMILTHIDTGKVLETNSAALEYFKIRSEEMSQQKAADFYADPEDRGRLLQQLRESQRIDSMELQVRDSAGERHWILLSARPIDYHGQRVLLTGCTDITQRKILEDEFRYQATVDELTGVANRRHFMGRAEVEFHRARRYATSLSIMLIDIDHFKQINDRCGHQVGDIALQEMAGYCEAALREDDLFGRIGGEEFGVLLPETGSRQARQLAERLCDGLRQLEVPCDRESLHFTVSIGIAQLGDGDQAVDAILKRADAALYQAKRAGRDRVVIYME